MSNTSHAGFVFLPPDDPEIQRAWQAFVDPVLAYQGEVIQYMGTSYRDGWCHTFRHRCHPETHEPLYWHIPAASGWAPEAP